MINKLLGAAAMAAIAYAVVPASAAKMAGCSSENLAKAESSIEAMADSEGKIVAQKEVAQAQDALLGGKMNQVSTQAPIQGQISTQGQVSTQAPIQAAK